MVEQPQIFQIAELVITDGREVLLHPIQTVPGKNVWDIFSAEVRDSSYREALQKAFPFASIAAAEFAGQVHKADRYERTGELALARRAFFVLHVEDLTAVQERVHGSRRVALNSLENERNSLRRAFLVEAVRDAAVHQNNTEPFAHLVAAIPEAKAFLEQHAWQYSEAA